MAAAIGRVSLPHSRSEHPPHVTAWLAATGMQRASTTPLGVGRAAAAACAGTFVKGRSGSTSSTSAGSASTGSSAEPSTSGRPGSGGDAGAAQDDDGDDDDMGGMFGEGGWDPCPLWCANCQPPTAGRPLPPCEPRQLGCALWPGWGTERAASVAAKPQPPASAESAHACTRSSASMPMRAAQTSPPPLMPPSPHPLTPTRLPTPTPTPPVPPSCSVRPVACAAALSGQQGDCGWRLLRSSGSRGKAQGRERALDAVEDQGAREGYQGRSGGGGGQRGRAPSHAWRHVGRRIAGGHGAMLQQTHTCKLPRQPAPAPDWPTTRAS